MELNDLYRDVILDHNRRPRNFGPLEGADATAEGFNPLCGDRLTLRLKLADDTISDIRFEGQGCAISTASASLMTEAVKGKTRGEALALFERVHGCSPTTRRRGRGSRQAGRIVRSARISRAREVREPVLAHPRLRAASSRARAPTAGRVDRMRA